MTIWPNTIKFLTTVAAGLVLTVAPAQAQEFDVPEGFLYEIERDTSHGKASAPATLRVQPETGAFAKHSTLEMRPLDEEIDNPSHWLQRRVTAQLGDSSGLAEIFDSPDSPFDDPSFEPLKDGLTGLSHYLSRLGELPLKFCEPPNTGSNRSGEYHELSCAFEAGPIHKFVVLRLQNIDDVWYYTTINTMNKKRLRHLIAIANSFHTD